MKKTYMKPTLDVENAMPENLLCESFYGDTNTGLTPGGGSNGEAQAPEWDVWGDAE